MFIAASRIFPVQNASVVLEIVESSQKVAIFTEFPGFIFAVVAFQLITSGALGEALRMLMFVEEDPVHLRRHPMRVFLDDTPFLV